MNPWNINFFSTYLDLNKEEIEAEELDRVGYRLTFKKSCEAIAYYEKKVNNTTYLMEPNESNQLMFYYKNEQRFIKQAAKKAKKIWINHISLPS